MEWRYKFSEHTINRILVLSMVLQAGAYTRSEEKKWIFAS